MVGAGVLSLTTLGYSELILRATLGGTGVSTLVGDVSPHFVMVIYVPSLEVDQVCSGGIETGLQVTLDLRTGFHECVKMVLQDWYLVMPTLNLHQSERHYQ